MHQAFLEIQQRLVHDNKLDAMDGVLVQPMILDGVELMIGVTQDPLFGPLIGFGLAGIHVEILKDICFRVTPITDRDAAEMVRSIQRRNTREQVIGIAIPRSKSAALLDAFAAGVSM